MRNALKTLVAAAMMISMPVSGAIAARPTASVPSTANLPGVKARSPWASPYFFIPVGIAIAIAVVTLAHHDKSEPPPVSRG